MEGLIFGGPYLGREIFVSKIDWASLIVRGKSTGFASFYFVFEGNFQVQDPRGGLIFGGAYIRNFTVYPLGVANIHKANIREYPGG